MYGRFPSGSDNILTLSPSRCYFWYHYGCVGIKPGDPMAEDQEMFTCPPCTSNGYVCLSISSEYHIDQTMLQCQYVSCICAAVRVQFSPLVFCLDPLISNRKGILCARPDCGEEETPANEFIVHSIIGRTTKVEGGRGRKYLWLVKWDG
jgi:hypothetical protein